MKNITLLTLIVLFYFSNSYSQQDSASCQVLMKTISKTYKGECKDGLANGKGTAIGKDFYVGNFKAGLPHGKGKYTFANGNSYDGNWENGIKQGKGKYRYYTDGTATIIKGYWKDDEYIGKNKPKDSNEGDNDDDSYRVNLSGIEYYSIKKIDSDVNEIEINFERVMTRYIPKDLEITFSTGYLNQMNKRLIITDYMCPLICTIHFTIRRADTYQQCSFNFDILKPGKYEVLISNK